MSKATMWMFTCRILGLLLCTSPIFTTKLSTEAPKRNLPTLGNLIKTNLASDIDTVRPIDTGGAGGKTYKPGKTGLLQFLFNVQNEKTKKTLIKRQPGNKKRPGGESTVKSVVKSPTELRRPRSGQGLMTSRSGQRMRISRTASCNDRDQLCHIWKRYGYCGHSYVPYMEHNCRKTCGICIDASHCKADEVPCPGYEHICMHHTKRCDGESGVDMCQGFGFSADEKACDTYQCQSPMVKCGGGSHLCVDKKWRCNGDDESYTGLCVRDSGNDEKDCNLGYGARCAASVKGTCDGRLHLQCLDDGEDGTVCRCPHTTHYTVDNTCRKKASHGEACTNSDQCMGTLTCLGVVCRCNWDQVVVGDSCVKKLGYGTRCASDVAGACDSALQLQCITSVCRCLHTTHYTVDKTCHKRVSHGDPCTAPGTCAGTLSCLGSVCRCPWTDKVVGNKCVKLSGKQASGAEHASHASLVELHIGAIVAWAVGRVASGHGQ